MEALKAIPIAANHKETFSIMHTDVSRAYFHAKAQRLVPVRLPREDRVGADVGKSWTAEEEHAWHTRRCEPLGV